MRTKLHFELDFYNEYQASAFMDTSLSSTEDQKYAKLVLFNCFALRQMHNLHDNAIPLANILFCKDYSVLVSELNSLSELSAYIPLIAALGEDISYLVPNMTAITGEFALSGLSQEDFVKKMWPNIARIVAQRSNRGEKQFEGDLEIKEERGNFQMHTRGFSLLGQGINYYAPMSVILFLRFLLNDQNNDKLFANRLKESAWCCGSSILKRMINAFNQPEVSILFADKMYSLIT